MANLISTAQAYIANNGGHSTVAPTIGVATCISAAICAGRRPVTPQFAAGMAALIGCTPAQLMNSDADTQFLTRRNSIS